MLNKEELNSVKLLAAKLGFIITEGVILCGDDYTRFGKEKVKIFYGTNSLLVSYPAFSIIRKGVSLENVLILEHYME